MTISLPSSGLFCEDDDDIEESLEDSFSNNEKIFHKTLPKESDHILISDNNVVGTNSQKNNIANLKLSSFDADKF